MLAKLGQGWPKSDMKLQPDVLRVEDQTDAWTKVVARRSIYGNVR
ncbi:hypothetical protein [Bradyrhizobium sp. USDA 4502]